MGGSTSLSKTLDLRRRGVVDNVRVCKFGIQIRTGLQIGTARFGCVCYGFRIGDWFGAEVIQKYLEICWIGALDDFSGVVFILERKHGLAGNGWRSNLSCWGALGIVQARRIAKREALHHLNFKNFLYTNKTGS